MRRAELAEQLERLGSYPTPLPDPRRVQEWERGLYREFVVQPSTAGPAAARARRRRRQILVGSLAAAAAACLAAFLLMRGSTPRVELDAASGAVVLMPDGSTRPLHAGDQIPPGGLIRTGPSGSVTIGRTKVGPNQDLLVDDGRLILLPVPPTTPSPGQAPPTDAVTTATAAPASSQAPASTARPPGPANRPSAVPPANPAVTAAPATDAPPTAGATPPAAPVAAAPQVVATMPELQLTVARDTEGVRLSWTTTDLATFERYVVVRGPADAPELNVIAELPDRQITSFTDPAAPHDIDLVYRVLALDAAGRPIAMSPTAMLEIGAASTTDPTDTDPPVTDPPATDPTVTDPVVTDPTVTDPAVTDPGVTDPPGTYDSVAPTSDPVDSTLSTDPPTTDAPDTSGAPATDDA